MHGGDVLAIERKGKPFLCANVGMMWMELCLYVTEKQHVLDNAKRLYERFGGTDPGEFECTLEELKNQKGDVIIVIPETKDNFIRLEDWLIGDRSCKFPKILKGTHI